MKIVIVGAGFGGLKTAIELSKRGLKNITLISSEDYFLHHATMYSTATGRDIRESVFPINEILHYHPNIKFVKDFITKIDTTKQKVFGKTKSYSYDSLVLSLGLVNQLSTVNGQKKFSYGVTSLEATKAFSDDFHDMVVADNKKASHCRIVGGGMVGVELAGALSDYVKRLKSAHQLKHANVDISLIESADRVLPHISTSAARKISKRLERSGVKIITNRKVSKIEKDNMTVNGKNLRADMVVWTLGGKNNPIYSNHPEIFKLSKRGKVIVNQYMQAYPGIYVIGDNAETEFSGSAVSAMRDAYFVAENIFRKTKGLPEISRRSKTTPTMAIPVTRFWAYVEYDGVYAAGFTGACWRRLVELNYYNHFLPLPKAYKMWRRYRKSNDYCDLCKTYDN